MGAIKVLRTDGDAVSELPGQSMPVESSLQTLIEGRFDTFLGVHFLASEHLTGPTHGGRIDALGQEQLKCCSAHPPIRLSNTNDVHRVRR